MYSLPAVAPLKGVSSSKKIQWICVKIHVKCFFSLSCRSVDLDNKATLSDHILSAVLGLLKKEVPEHGRHLQQYFHFFLMYSTIGPPEV